MYVSVYLSVCLFVYLSAYLSVSLSIPSKLCIVLFLCCPIPLYLYPYYDLHLYLFSFFYLYLYAVYLPERKQFCKISFKSGGWQDQNKAILRDLFKKNDKNDEILRDVLHF
jgi:hypothetical protein